MAQMKEQIKAPDKIQLSDEEIANLSNKEFKTPVIRMLTEMVECGHKIEEKVKVMQSELKIHKEPTVKGRKPGLTSTVWSRRKKEAFNQNRMKKQEYKKNKERLRNLQDKFKHSNIRIIGVPEGGEEVQEIKNLFENILKENFTNLAKEIDF